LYKPKFLLAIILVEILVEAERFELSTLTLKVFCSTTELRFHVGSTFELRREIMVGLAGFEPTEPYISRPCGYEPPALTRLSYRPNIFTLSSLYGIVAYAVMLLVR
jgi:hypothetical protein